MQHIWIAFQNKEEWHFSFWDIFFSFYRYWCICIMQLRKVITSSKTVHYWIKNRCISGNIRAVFFNLGTRNVHFKRNKMSPIVWLSWQRSMVWQCCHDNGLKWCTFLVPYLKNAASNISNVKKFSLFLQSPKLVNPLSTEIQNASSIAVFIAKLTWYF